MRWIALGILCNSSIDIDDHLIPLLQEQFIYQLPNHEMYDSDDETHVFVFWNKIGIPEDINMNQKTREIEDAIENDNIVVVDLGEDPTFWKKHGNVIMSIVGAFVISVLVWYLSRHFP